TSVSTAPGPTAAGTSAASCRRNEAAAVSLGAAHAAYSRSKRPPLTPRVRCVRGSEGATGARGDNVRDVSERARPSGRVPLESASTPPARRAEGRPARIREPARRSGRQLVPPIPDWLAHQIARARRRTLLTHPPRSPRRTRASLPSVHRLAAASDV